MIPEAKTPLTASNLLDQLTDVVPSKGVTIAQQRKKAVISLTTALVNRVTDLSTDQLLPTIEAFIKAADQKHLQIYLLDPTAQTDMVAVGWAGALDPPDGTTDLVGVSNSDVEPSKANLGVTKSLDYTVVLKPDGGAGSTLTLGYKKSGRKLPGIPDAQWANYLRAHRHAAGSGLEGCVHVAGRSHRRAHLRALLPASTRIAESGAADDHAAGPSTGADG